MTLFEPDMKLSGVMNHAGSKHKLFKENPKLIVVNTAFNLSVAEQFQMKEVLISSIAGSQEVVYPH